MPSLLRFARYREIAVEIASRLASNGDEEIIVSSGGLAAAATAELLRETKSGVVSVRLAMLDEFARRVVNEAGEYPRAATDMERRLAMRAAIAEIDEPMMETRGIASMLERSYRDVRDGGMTLDAFEKAIKRGISLRDRKRTEMLIRAWRAYERRIADLQAVDAADILERAAALIESERVPVAAQVIAGFYDMTGAQLRLLHALEKSGKITAILVPIGDDSAYAFASRFVSHVGRASARQEPALHIKASEVTVAQFENKESELRTICNSIRELLDAGTPANQIGITARALDPDDVRLLRRFAGELGFQVSASLEFPLLGHRLGRGIATILRLRERNFPRSEVIDVLRDGFVPQHRVEIDAIDKATRRARISGGRSTEIRNAANDPRIEDYRAVVAELELLKTLAEIAERFRLDTDLDLAAAAAVDDIVSLLSRWKQPVSAETMIELLEQQSLGQRPAANGQPLVWAGDVMKFRGRSFAHLFVIRAQDGVFPQRRVS